MRSILAVLFLMMSCTATLSKGECGGDRQQFQRGESNVYMLGALGAMKHCRIPTAELQQFLLNALFEDKCQFSDKTGEGRLEFFTDLKRELDEITETKADAYYLEKKNPYGWKKGGGVLKSKEQYCAEFADIPQLLSATKAKMK